MARPKLVPDTTYSDQERGLCISLEWAEEQYVRALNKLEKISPVVSLATVKQGDVMLSKSGNTRLIIDVEKKVGGAVLHFLSRLRNSKVKLESAPLQKVDLAKVDALVVRREGNPLEKFSDIARNVEKEEVVLHNIRVLLQSGMLGGQIRSALLTLKQGGDVFVDIDLWVQAGTGAIQKVGGEEPSEPCHVVTLSFNCLGTPSEEYIKSARFDRDCASVVKRNILAASVMANTIENARNLSCIGKTAGL